MCGIIGLYQKGASKEIGSKMLSALQHRGPDALNLYEHNDTILGHARLSIIDLVTGDQPIFNDDGTKCIVYNGEMYNYRDLQSKMEAQGIGFHTASDTEVVLKAYEVYGQDCLSMFNGMFAFAIYDLVTGDLFIARDRFGIKPLHYYHRDGLFAFASEQKAILAHPDVMPRLNHKALHLHLNLRYTQGEETLFEGIRRLPPGHFMTVKKGGIDIRRYWTWTPEVNHDLSESQAIDGLHHHLYQAVERQMVSDVPIGVYLSGGLDSSTIVQKMSEIGVPEINTFTLGFNEPTDEHPDARLVAQHFGTNHHESNLQLNPLSNMREVIYHAEEPKINLLQGYHMSAFVQPHVKVVLGGLGGDELLAGYDIHRLIQPSNGWHRRIPRYVQKLMRWKSDFLYKVQSGTGTMRFDEYRRGMQMLLSIGDIERYYLILRNVWDFDDPFYKKVYSKEYLQKMRDQLPQTHTEFDSYFGHGSTPLDEVLLAELQTKMVNDYLLVEDRMSMSHSVEERVPFLDNDLVDYCLSIPIEYKIKNGETKALFRKAMASRLPERIVRKKKWGFSVNPYLQFKKDLKDTVERELTREYIEQQGIFNYDYIRSILDTHPHPRMRWHYNYLWILLGLKYWEEEFQVSF